MENWKPNYSGKKSFKKRNRFTLEDGDNVFRILPQPKGKNLERSSDWSKYLSIHFGYKNLEGKHRLFQSSLMKKNKEVLVGDPALDRINELKGKLEEAKAAGNQPLVARLTTLVGQRGVYNLDNGHHMNAMDLNGNIGELKIRHKAKLDLDNEIKKLQDAGIDPLSFEDGRYFVFTRSNEGRDTAVKVSVYKEKVEIQGLGIVEREFVHKVTPDILSRLETEGHNLENLAPKVTPEEIAQIVAEADLLSGKSAACNRVFDDRWKAERESKKAAQAQLQTQVKAQVQVQPSTGDKSSPDLVKDSSGAILTTGKVLPNPTPEPVVLTKTTPPNLDSQLMQSITNPPNTQPKPSQAQAVEEMSDEDFFKSLNVQV